MSKKKKILTALLILATGTWIWLGEFWYDVPVKKDIRGNVDWSNWNGGHH